MFNYVASQAQDSPGELSDLRPNVPKAFGLFCLAEGQVITVDRAVQSKHSQLLIAGLCRDTSDKFRAALDTLNSPNPTPKVDVSRPLAAYLEFKREFYTAKAHFHHAVHFAHSESTEAGKSLKANLTAIETLKAALPQIEVFAHGPKAGAAKGSLP